MSEIIFVRHAETDMAGKFCGHSDPELNSRGWIQVDELIGRLRTEDVGRVYTSDLRRSNATARALAEAFDIECRVRPSLREIDFGRWEGLTWEEIERRDSDYARRWIMEYPRLEAPGGESFDGFERRVLDEVRLLMVEAADADRSIAVVTHAGVLRCVLRTLHGYSDEDAWKQAGPYCAVVRLHP